MEILEPTLESLYKLESLSWIFVGGKGGVGKTTISSCIAIELAKTRESVLLLSTDPAHNLGDAFSQKFSGTPTLVNGFKNLYAMELDNTPKKRAEYEEFASDKTGFGQFLPELISCFPGIYEALSFAELMNFVRNQNYSTIVFDTAPTGHTIRLLGFPDLLEKGIDKIMELRDKMSGTMNMFQSLTGDLFNNDELNEKLDHLKVLTTSVKSNFQDPFKTTFVCVSIPEFLSVYETERLVQELAKFQIDTSYIVVNQVIFPIEEADSLEIDSETLSSLMSENSVNEKYKSLISNLNKKADLYKQYFIARKKIQSKYLMQIEELYSYDFHVIPMPLQLKEVRGVEALQKFSKLLLEPRKLPIEE